MTLDELRKLADTCVELQDLEYMFPPAVIAQLVAVVESEDAARIAAAEALVAADPSLEPKP